MIDLLLQWFWQLPRPLFAISRGLDQPVAMRDGAVLLTDVYSPRGAVNAPTMLIRSPYGRGSLFGPMARIFAAQGYVTVIQSCRGTFGSGGTFNPFFQERDDGLDTVDWIERQPWYAGKLGLFGPSYLGQVQWAMAAELGDRVAALAPIITTSDFRSTIFDGGSFRLEDFFKWISMVTQQEKTSSLVMALKERLFGDPLRNFYAGLPLRTLDQRALGVEIDYWRAWLDHEDPADPFWKPLLDIENMARVQAPVTLVAGWSDVFIRYQVRDYKTLKDLGKTVRLTVGPWAHTDFRAIAEAVRDGLDWFDMHLKGRAPQPDDLDRVRLWMHGADEWREYRAWPSNDANPLQWNLGADGKLTTGAAQSGSLTFTYDPDNPTPSLEGAKLVSRTGRGDMRPLATRSDVLTFDGPVLDALLELRGAMRVTLTTSATSDHHDLFVCVCDVAPDGRAINITDAFTRLSSQSGGGNTRTTTLETLPLAWRVAAGHRLQLLVAAGAFPRFARNLGWGEPIGSATRTRKVDITIHCGGDASSLVSGGG
jgi:putative CocE/NonD family hydrolase